MSAPGLTIIAEPLESASLVYGPLAGRSALDPEEGQLSLVLRITNDEASQVHLNLVTVTFTGPPSVPTSSIPADVSIDPAKTASWYFAPANNVILPVPAPGAVEIGLWCDGYSDPAVLALPLAPYVSPAAGEGYLFPGSIDDLAQGEYWTGRSAAHGGAGGGTQLFAYDLVIRGYDEAGAKWSTTLPGSDNTLNESYHIWGTPIYAMADGVVKQFKDGMPANTPPQKPSTTPNPVEGNHFYIQHGPDLALYAHFQAGTLNPLLTSGPNQDGTGATVARGQLLGLAGNSGNSSEPHLHLQVNRTTKPWGGPTRPLLFEGIHVLDLSLVDPDVWPPNKDLPWNPVSSQALPRVAAAIWPAPPLPGTVQLGRFSRVAAWMWLIVIGGLMFTPDGIECIACGPVVTRVLGAISIGLGVAGLIAGQASGRGPRVRRLAARIDAKDSLHG